MFFARLRKDIAAAKKNDPAARNKFEIWLTYSGVHALSWHRWANFLYRIHLKLLARMTSQFAKFLTGIEIHPAAKIAAGVFIDHGAGVVIGETAEVEEGVVIYQGVTLGGTGKEKGKRHPTIKRGATISCGAKVLGGFTVGTTRSCAKYAPCANGCTNSKSGSTRRSATPKPRRRKRAWHARRRRTPRPPRTRVQRRMPRPFRTRVQRRTPRPPRTRMREKTRRIGKKQFSITSANKTALLRRGTQIVACDFWGERVRYADSPCGASAYARTTKLPFQWQFRDRGGTLLWCRRDSEPSRSYNVAKFAAERKHIVRRSAPYNGLSIKNHEDFSRQFGKNL